MPIDPSFLAAGPEWSVGGAGSAADGVPSVDESTGGGGGGFGDMLAKQIGNLEQMQGEAAQASRALADGTATDPTSVVMAVERAQLAMQMAATLRTKAVEAVNDVMHTQV